MRRRDLLSAAAGAVIATALAGGIAFAAIPNSGGVINGCYQKNEGQLRVIDQATQSCRLSEIGIAWNEFGVRGAKGDKGDPGAPGADGRDGGDGVDARVEVEPAGANCPAGGAKVIAAGGVVYVCKALPSGHGQD
jgi:hypothetical protein